MNLAGSDPPNPGCPRQAANPGGSAPPAARRAHETRGIQAAGSDNNVKVEKLKKRIRFYYRLLFARFLNC